MFQCEHFEELGEDILVFCTSSDRVISSSKAVNFVQHADQILAQFKSFCCGKYKCNSVVILLILCKHCYYYALLS